MTVRYLSVFLFVFLLSGCATRPPPHLATDLANEHWQGAVEARPLYWQAGADRWFLTGEAKLPRARARNGEATMTTMKTTAGNFSDITIDGGFQVQIFGSDHNSVFIYGPNAAVGEISVEQGPHAIYIRAKRNAPPTMPQVIVRIGVANLRQLVQAGCGSIEAIQVTSRALRITTTPKASGNIWLSGAVNLQRINKAGTSSIVVFGANTQRLDITTSGQGAVNVIGNVGARRIEHHGATDINIIGAQSPFLVIVADGTGKIGIQGQASLKKIIAKDSVQIYLYTVYSDLLVAEICDCARVGLAGRVGDLYVNTSGASQFLGRGLCALNIFAQTKGRSHSNLTACNKAYVTAQGESSAYFFGPAYLLSRYQKDNAIVLPIEERNWCTLASEYRPYTYTLSGPPWRANFKGE